MDEAKRFLRYVVPGVLYLAETAFLLWLAYPAWTAAELKVLADASWAIAIAGLATSGVLGYVFANVHHWLHWHSPTDRGIIDHTKAIARLRHDRLLTSSADSSISERLDALDAITAEWFVRNQQSTPVGNATARGAAFTDLAHAAGTARVASAASLATVLIVYCKIGVWAPSADSGLRLAAMLAIGVGLVLLFQDNYKRAGGMGARFYERVLEVALRRERDRVVNAAARRT